MFRPALRPAFLNMSPSRRGASSRTGRDFCTGCCLLLSAGFFFTDCLADVANTQYRQAVEQLNQFRDNMNGHWFAFSSVEQDWPDGVFRKQRQHGVLFYSESRIYISSLATRISNDGQEVRTDHKEVLLTDEWVLSARHGPNGSALNIVERSGKQSEQYADVHRRMTDLNLLFSQRVVSFVTHPFARPAIGDDGRLVVKYGRAAAVRDADPAQQSMHRIFEVFFSSDSIPRPILTRLLRRQPDGTLQQLGFVQTDYGVTSRGRPIVRRLLSQLGPSTKPDAPTDHPVNNEARSSDDAHAVDDRGAVRSPRSEQSVSIGTEHIEIRIREIEAPAWSVQPPVITLLSGDVVRLENVDDTLATPDVLPEAVSSLVRQLPSVDYQRFLAAHTQTLTTTRPYVEAEAVTSGLALADTAWLPTQEQVTTAGTMTLALTSIAVACAVMLAWAILWKRMYRRDG